MHNFGAITGYVDLAQIILYMFWLFFAGLIFYLVRENHREGYPMESDSMGKAVIRGWPIPDPKTFKLSGGREVTVPNLQQGEPPRAYTVMGASPGSPIEPTGDAMLDGVGPGGYALRADEPDRDLHGQPLIRPLRAVSAFGVSDKDVDPRGLPVVGGDGKQGGTVTDLWVDTAEMMFRYLEVDAGGRKVLLPMPFALIRRNAVEVSAVYGHHFAKVPGTRSPDQVTKLEEEKISAFYAGGTLYADPKRLEPKI